jgi:hypothetical protein
MNGNELTQENKVMMMREGLYSIPEHISADKWRCMNTLEQMRALDDAGCWGPWADETRIRLTEARRTIERLQARIDKDNAVCLCGCPASEHEDYGEDGESCSDETHDCIRVAVGVARLFRLERDEAQRKLAERDEQLTGLRQELASRDTHACHEAYMAGRREAQDEWREIVEAAVEAEQECADLVPYPLVRAVRDARGKGVLT